MEDKQISGGRLYQNAIWIKIKMQDSNPILRILYYKLTFLYILHAILHFYRYLSMIAPYFFMFSRAKSNSACKLSNRMKTYNTID